MTDDQELYDEIFRVHMSAEYDRDEYAQRFAAWDRAQVKLNEADTPGSLRALAFSPGEQNIIRTQDDPPGLAYVGNHGDVLKIMVKDEPYLEGAETGPTLELSISTGTVRMPLHVLHLIYDMLEELSD